MLSLRVIFWCFTVTSPHMVLWGQAAILSRLGPASGQTCAELVNQGTFSTVMVEVGTPPQQFDLVADTGSDVLIVQSCMCQANGYCGEDSKCFEGNNKSKTFNLLLAKEAADQKKTKNGEFLKVSTPETKPQELVISFGSGQIGGVLASDVVKSGGVSTNMSDGFLLMTAAQLDFQQTIEGILGLGPASSLRVEAEAAMKKEYEEQQKRELAAQKKQEAEANKAGAKNANETGEDVEAEDWMKSIKDILGGSMGLPDAEPQTGTEAGETVQAAKSPNSFLEQASLQRFSMCFVDGANGTMRLQPPPASHQHSSFGKFHWGLGFSGISVGDATTPVTFCHGENMSEGQQTACGAIPDSGSTLFSGPTDQVTALIDSICDRWPLCKKNHTALVEAADAASKIANTKFGFDPWNIEAGSKKTVLDSLLADCGQWLDKSKGLDEELPVLHFHVTGQNGTKQTLSFSGAAYVMEAEQELVNVTNVNIPGIGEIPMGSEGTGEFQKVCQLAFGTMDYNTKENGPVWILGTPLFYEYEVGYDIKENTISFTSLKDQPCGACTPQGVVNKRSEPALMSARRAPRRVRRPYRSSRVNTAVPL